MWHKLQHNPLQIPSLVLRHSACGRCLAFRGNYLYLLQKIMTTYFFLQPKALYILFEHATGYALFRAKEFEEIAMLEPAVEESVTNLAKFQAIVSLVSFSPFKTGTNALDNMNSISEGIMHEDLRLFLESNMPTSSKKKKVILGVGDSKIGASISEELGYSCMHTGVVPEITRGNNCF